MTTQIAPMRKTSTMHASAPLRLFAAVILCAGIHIAHAEDADLNPSAALLAKYGAAQDRLNHNPFHGPLYLDSSETSDGVSGDIYARVDYPFATVSAALNNPGNWCEILILHLNTKYCRASHADTGSVLNVSIGKKTDQPLDDAYRVAFTYQEDAQAPDYLHIRLNAAKGPLSTKNYRIALEAIPLKNGQTFIHLAYSYGYGLLGRLAMQAYLGTLGKGKVGFTVTGTQANGQQRYIGGMRGVVERNTMRYYLAIDAFLNALSAAPQAQPEKRLRDWFAASERYSLQLHEMDQAAYLDMKHHEVRRQQTVGVD